MQMQAITAAKREVPNEIWDAWGIPDEISIPDWVEKNVRLSEKTSAEPGQLRISRTPYIRGPFEAFQDIFIEEIVVVWGRQLGKTTLLFALMCYLIAQDPGPATFILPTQDKAREISETKLDPMFRACPEVVERMPENPDDYTKLLMNFRTMIFAMAWAGADTQTTTRSNRYVFVDEADEIKKQVGQNAIDPIKGIEQTTTTFSNRKVIKSGTPTVEGGNIWQALKACDLVFEYWIPCPHCGATQILYWENVKFGDDHDPVVVEEMAYYECEACGKRISNLDKIRILGAGEWRARLTPDPCEQIRNKVRAKIEETISLGEALASRRYKKLGFHLPKWYSPFPGGALGVIAKEFLEANKALQEGQDFALMRNWRIYDAALPWSEEAPTKTEIELMENRISLSPMVCPAGTLALTCGMDPSEGGFFTSVVAWYLYQRAISPHLVDYRLIYDWLELEKFLRGTAYPVEGGGSKRIIVSGLDTGGSEYETRETTMTEEAYIWLKKMRTPVPQFPGGLNVFGTKGMSHESKYRAKQSKIEKMPGPKGKPIPGGLVLWEINTDEMKRVVWFHLKVEAGKTGRFTFHSETGEDYVKQLLAEKEERDKKGKWQWVRKGRNHYLDATVIAFALAERDCYGLQILSNVVPRTERKVYSQGVE